MIELSLTEMRKTGTSRFGVRLGGGDKELSLDILTLRCWLDIQVVMPSSQLET